MAPVTAQVMMTLRAHGVLSFLRGRCVQVYVLGDLVRGQRGKAFVAPLRQRRDAFRRRLMRPCRDHPVHIRALINLGSGGSRRKLLVEARVARTVIRNAAGRIEFDGLERAEKRPAQSEPILHGMVEILSRDIAFADQPKGLRQQRALQPVENKAVDLAVDGDRNLPDLAIDVSRTVDRLGRGPWRAAQFDQRHQMRRIDGMTDQAARAARQRLREARRGDGRGRGYQQRIRRREPVEFGKDRNLVFDLFRPVFLDEFDVLDGVRQARRQSRRRATAPSGSFGQPVARQRVQFVADQAGALLSASA